MVEIMMNRGQGRESKEKLKELLRELFQFDCKELDFGIYRIMNYKRQEINDFIENDLIKAVEKEFEKYKAATQKEIKEEFGKVKKELISTLGESALEVDGEVKDEFRGTPVAQTYQKVRKQLEEIDITEDIQSQVFNDLYNFFFRYYEDGDFISKRRYSSNQYKYAIPYSGEEVKLHWANFDQYYVKTGEVFKDYEFNSKGWNFIFTTVFADVEVGNIKGGSRYFFLAPARAINIDNQNKVCLIKFEYRPLAERDLRLYPVKTKEGKEKTTGITQDELNQILKEKILKLITSTEPKAILLETEDEKSFLERHLYKYTHKITSDFFIHKNLKGFLERELDYFIKTEVLDLSNLDERHIARAKVVENIGKRIIEFLSQIEEFQKTLWEKKKFVLSTDYVITLDRIPGEFHQEVLNNKRQSKEWEELGFEIATPSARNDERRVSLRGTKSRSNLKLPVDTKYFSEEFKETLLEKLSQQGSLDDLIDGVLIKSENWQALNLILGKYKGKVQCIYIDPPFNTGTNEFLYKNKYLDSSWVTMMYDRLDLGRKLLKNDGSIYVRIDYHGNHYVRSLMDIVFREENFRNEVVISRTRAKQEVENQFIQQTESLFFYSKGNQMILKSVERERGPEWHSLLHFPRADDKPRIILDKKFYPPRGRRWALSQERIDRFAERGKIRINKEESYVDCHGKKVVGVPELLYDSEIVGNEWLDIPGYSQAQHFPTENSEILLKRVIESTSNEGDLVMDFFLGSGTTTAVAQKLGRKWLGVEMGEFFEDFPLARMKKVLYGERSGISKEINWKGGGFFKYQYVEQYEDTLHNIEFPNEERAQQMLKLFGEEEASEYLMKYVLSFETEGSPSLLNLKQFEKPSDYKLRTISGGKAEKITGVDLVETFNYLIGLKVSKYKSLKKNGRKYIFVLGERNNRRVAVVWRPAKDINLEKDKKVIEGNTKDFAPDDIFINGDSLVKGYKPIESEFKALMAR
jgi:adenine-specific DNA-methyltransferase